MFEYPQYEEDGQEKLFFPNLWREIESQPVVGTECFNPNAVLNNEENLIVLKLTAVEFTEIFSALYNGAVMTYPSRFLQILVNFLAGLHCPPILEEQDCFEYPSYASFIQYSPVNPYLQPDEIPDGYLTQPFLINGQNGVDIPNYEPFDILVPIDAITFDVNWFEDIGGQLPQITVMVQGAGKAYIKMLSQVGSGLAIITLDNPPNILDIIGGIITGADNIVDLNLDIVSLPPETAIEMLYELDVVGTGIHTIYIVFLPILDDSLIPLRFGGGFRGVQLCDFVEQPIMGIQDIRFNDATCNLETLIDGEWEIVTGWENWLDCVPSGGGGGGASGITTKVYKLGTAGTGGIGTTSTTFVDMTGLTFDHTPTKANMLVLMNNILVANTTQANQPLTVRILADGNVGLDAIEQVHTNSAVDPLSVGDRWTVTPDVSIAIKLQWKVGGGNGGWSQRQTINVTILEYDDAADLEFVQDIRILDGELQKKIGGAWIAVTESLAALLDSIAAAAAAAQSTATGAVTTNIAQQAQINSAITVNNLQNTRLDDLEDFQADAELSIAGLNAQVISLDSRVDALEANAANSAYWSETFNFITSDGGWVAANGETYAAGQGWQSENGLGTLEIRLPGLFAGDGRITHMKLRLRADVGLGNLPNTYLIKFPFDGDEGNGYVAGTGTTLNFWYKVKNIDENYLYVIRIDMAIGAVDYTLREVQFLGKGDNPF